MGADSVRREIEEEDDEPFACVNYGPYSKGWLVDLVNRFGSHGGFARLAERFSPQNMSTLTVPLIHALVRPFGQCYDVLTPSTVANSLQPMVESVPLFLDNLNDDELKKEAKN